MGRYSWSTTKLLEAKLSKSELDFLRRAFDTLDMLLPHIGVGSWELIDRKSDKKRSRVKWSDSDRKFIDLSIHFPNIDRTIASMAIRRLPREVKTFNDIKALDNTEFKILNVFVRSVTYFLNIVSRADDEKLLGYYSDMFGDFIVLDYLKEEHGLDFDLAELVEFLKELSEESYENKSLSYGVIIDKSKKGYPDNRAPVFPRDFSREKKFKLLSDGYRTAFLLNNKSNMLELWDLEEKNKNGSLTGEHYFPEWSRNIALQCRKNRIGFALTRQGDILYFQDGSLKLSRRFGRWQYWNHSYIIAMLKRKARAQHVSADILGKVVSHLYRYSLDISFRRSGGLFVLMRNQQTLRKIVRNGDGISDLSRSNAHKRFEGFLKQRSILGIPKNVIIELSAIDGAIVLSNHGWLLAYGAVLMTKKGKEVTREQGSRSKAALSASFYGIAIKISSDGAISFFEEGNKFMEI